MKATDQFKPCLLNEKGLNLQAVFNINELPEEIIKHLKTEHSTLEDYQQLILIGHGGNFLWQSMQQYPSGSTNPIDEYSIKTVNKWFTVNYPENNAKLIYPGKYTIALQTLGTLAGWHHVSPFMVGINTEWGSWYAYRAVLLTDTRFKVTQAIKSSSPCSACENKVCIEHCPPNACKSGSLNMDACIDYRKSKGSKCRETCLARINCPVASEHSYSEQQINYHYSVSMKTIETYNY